MDRDNIRGSQEYSIPPALNQKTEGRCKFSFENKVMIGFLLIFAPKPALARLSAGPTHNLRRQTMDIQGKGLVSEDVDDTKINDAVENDFIDEARTSNDVAKNDIVVDGARTSNHDYDGKKDVLGPILGVTIALFFFLLLGAIFWCKRRNFGAKDKMMNGDDSISEEDSPAASEADRVLPITGEDNSCLEEQDQKMNRMESEGIQNKSNQRPGSKIHWIDVHKCSSATCEKCNSGVGKQTSFVAS